jgi:hypothetical protein
MIHQLTIDQKNDDQWYYDGNLAQIGCGVFQGLRQKS